MINLVVPAHLFEIRFFHRLQTAYVKLVQAFRRFLGIGFVVHRLEQRPVRDGLDGSSVRWGDAVEGTARELMAEAEVFDSDGGTRLDDAVIFLSKLLANGPKYQQEIMAAAADAGHSEVTIRRAKKRLKIEAKKDGIKRGWRWHFFNGDHLPKMIKFRDR